MVGLFWLSARLRAGRLVFWKTNFFGDSHWSDLRSNQGPSIHQSDDFQAQPVLFQEGGPLGCRVDK